MILSTTDMVEMYNAFDRSDRGTYPERDELPKPLRSIFDAQPWHLVEFARETFNDPDLAGLALNLLELDAVVALTGVDWPTRRSYDLTLRTFAISASGTDVETGKSISRYLGSIHRYELDALRRGILIHGEACIESIESESVSGWFSYATKRAALRHVGKLEESYHVEKAFTVYELTLPDGAARAGWGEIVHRLGKRIVDASRKDSVDS